MSGYGHRPGQVDWFQVIVTLMLVVTMCASLYVALVVFNTVREIEKLMGVFG